MNNEEPTVIYFENGIEMAVRLGAFNFVQQPTIPVYAGTSIVESLDILFHRYEKILDEALLELQKLYNDSKKTVSTGS